MQSPRKFNRRRVLKTIGAGVVGSTILAGSATATSGGVHLEGLDFDPQGLTVTLDGNGEGEVTFHHTDEDPAGIVHDVDIHHDSMNGHVVSNALQKGDTYTVSFEKDDDELVVDGRSTKRVDFDGSVTLEVHCNLHPGMKMDKGLTVDN